ncbi:Coatomer subunit gamma [Spatholobus suberectus]|nr:Coatomer subunit gamma [Spatholobus suberectus]
MKCLWSKRLVCYDPAKRAMAMELLHDKYFSEVRDRAALYLNTLGGDGSIVQTGKDVKDLLFESFDIPLVNLETSLGARQEPLEEAFDINSVHREVKSNFS